MVKIARRRRSSPQVSAQVGEPVSEPVDAEPGAVATDPAPPALPAPGAPSAPADRLGTVATGRALLRSAHPRWALALAVGMAAAAAATGREPREIALVTATVLVGQAVLGWHNDLVDRDRDREHRVADKPVADGRLETGTVWFAIACGVLLLVPLAVTNGITAGSAFLLHVLVGVLGNVVLRQGLLSWLPWAASYALLPAFLSYGGWGGQHEGDPPRILMTVLFALLGIGVHLVGSVWGLVPDDASGWRTLPLRIGRRTGSSRLLALGVVWTLVALVALVVSGAGGGLVQ